MGRNPLEFTSVRRFKLRAGFADNPPMPTDARTVLAIDDDVDFVAAVASMIDCAEYRTAVATNGTEGLRLARALSPAVVLCDLSMPGLGGVEVLRMLRADSATAHIPLVLMSGYASPSLRGIVADAFLAKPFSPATVQRLVRALAPPREVQAWKSGAI